MVLRSLLVALALLAPAVAQSPPLSQPIAIRACVQLGTHGSVANLSDAEVVAPGTALPRRTLYWFDQNIAGFAERVGQRVEITAAATQLIDEPREFQASDGVFAEIDSAAPQPGVQTVAIVGDPAAPNRAIGTSGADSAAPEHPVVVKATVSAMRMVGSCR